MSEQERLLEHEYDGIREYDNPTPKWWTWIFWGSVIFSLAYWVNPGGVIRGSRVAEYDQAMAAAATRWPKPAGGPDAAAILAARNDPSALALGRTTFASTCASCHRADAGGLIGPNLTDDYWLHGGTPVEIAKVITDGVLEKGMPPWGKLLKPDQITAVTAYIVSLHDTDPPNPRAPQGVKVEDDE